jgi:hypothetical protein
MRLAAPIDADLLKALALPLVAAALLAAGAAPAKTTVCTVTVNSSDEREALRDNLPAGDYEFEELMERGRPDWLGSSCSRGVRCDVLVVSGHFAGTEFYSSRPAVNESLSVDEIERVACGASCPNLFSHLREVYLFGCDSLKAEPVKSAMPEIVRGLVREGRSNEQAEREARRLSARQAESARDRIRRIFPGVPVIYGFASLAPYGRVAGPMLAGYLHSSPEVAFGSGVPSAKLLRLFGPSSMVATDGLQPGEPLAAAREESCRLYDDRIGEAQRLAEMHRLLAAPWPQLRMSFDTLEKFLGAVPPAARVAAFVPIASDLAARERYLAAARVTSDPALRLRMVELARSIGWLDAAQQRQEHAGLVADLLAQPALGYGEVDLVCALNADHGLDGASLAGARSGAAHEAARACLGDVRSRSVVLRALAASDEEEVRAAQAYLRYRPLTDVDELRHVAGAIAAMKPSPAQARALDALGRQHVADPAVLDALARLFARTTSLAVQRAIAEVFLRAAQPAPDRASLASMLRRHRLPARDADVIDMLIHRLQPS